MAAGPRQPHTLGSRAALGPGLYWEHLQAPGHDQATGSAQLCPNSSERPVFGWATDTVMSEGLSYPTGL